LRQAIDIVIENASSDAGPGALHAANMVNPEPEIYLTDFLNRFFLGEIAKNRGFCGIWT